MRCSVVTAKSPVVGSRSRAVTIARACAVFTSPAPNAPARVGWDSNAVATFRSDRAEILVCRVSAAAQSATEAAAVMFPAPARSASANTRNRNASTCPCARARSTSVVRCSSGLIDHVGVAASSVSRAHRRPVNSVTGWVRSSS